MGEVEARERVQVVRVREREVDGSVGADKSEDTSDWVGRGVLPISVSLTVLLSPALVGVLVVGVRTRPVKCRLSACSRFTLKGVGVGEPRPCRGCACQSSKVAAVQRS